MDVTEQIGNATQAAAFRQYASMKLACISLASRVQAAQAGPAIPDPAMQRLYSKALAGLSGTATDCQHAISVHQAGDEDIETHENNTLLNRTLWEFTAQAKMLYKATAEIQAIRVR